MTRPKEIAPFHILRMLSLYPGGLDLTMAARSLAAPITRPSPSRSTLRRRCGYHGCGPEREEWAVLAPSATRAVTGRDERGPPMSESDLERPEPDLADAGDAEQ